MALLKYRDLAASGIISDVDPYDLPLGAWSFGVNVRFRNKRVVRAPVFRKVDALASADPRYVFAVNEANSTDSLYIGYKNGRVFQWANGAETDYSIAGFVNSAVEATWTGCALGGVTYANRSDRVPWSLTPGDSQFTALANWDAGWTAKLLKAYNGALVALNVTKGGINYPTLVKTSDIVSEIGTVPSSWDHTLTTNNATENPLTKLKGPIVDACELGDSLIIYGYTQTFVMVADGSDNVYRYRQLPFDMGAINANCSITVDGRQYVFGPNDIWMHDGISKQSVIGGKNREFVFSNMNASKASKFFVAFNPNLRELSFCYVSGDRGVTFTEGTGCNKAAVLDLNTMVWSFDDLPLVHSSASAALSISTLTYENATATYATAGGTYQDLEDGLKKAAAYVGEANATYGLVSALYAHDQYGDGSIITADVDENANPAMLLERDGIDLDEIDANLRGYKHVTGLYPQGRLQADSAPIEFAFGSSDYPNVAPQFSDYQTYDGAENYKLDYTDGGRFLSMKVRYDDYKVASLSGLDIEVEVTGDL